MPHLEHDLTCSRCHHGLTKSPGLKSSEALHSVTGETNVNFPSLPPSFFITICRANIKFLHRLLHHCLGLPQLCVPCWPHPWRRHVQVCRLCSPMPRPGVILERDNERSAASCASSTLSSWCCGLNCFTGFMAVAFVFTDF